MGKTKTENLARKIFEALKGAGCVIGNASVPIIEQVITETLDLEWPPEGCQLVAHDTGDGWALMVENQERDAVGYLAWPSTWPETMSASRLREIGFVVV